MDFKSVGISEGDNGEKHDLFKKMETKIFIDIMKMVYKLQ